eukprot:CAMPEP_0180613682 /NCGR_PEP_ID=MMETSP1037_2-20121125/31022_1 /TAXON_ID=632150 /ORGANISM="Azadinium spinosum, Strain 3D9" /LENGTH=33 /DNA_ID= /DNA_START= /DNA_END= /DNA_ORIENTATION=
MISAPSAMPKWLPLRLNSIDAVGARTKLYVGYW